MTIDTTKLRELAQTARPGPWERDICQIDKMWLKGRLQECVTNQDAIVMAVTAEDDATAEFIAAANPATVLALLDELEKRTLRADILEEMVTRAQHHVIFSRELDKGMLKRLLTAGSDKWVYSLRNELSDAVMEIDRLTDENVRLRTIEAAARNLVKVKGRHHAEIAAGSRAECGD
jgi:hypothetical protein